MSRLSEYMEGLRGGGGDGRWGALGRRDREAQISRRAARRAYVPPEEEIVEDDEPTQEPEPEPEVVPEPAPEVDTE